MIRQHPAGRVRSPPHLGPPVAAGHRQVDLGVDEIDDAVDDFVLVGDVVVHRHRFDTEFLGERADGQRPDPAGVGDGDRTGQHPVPAERNAFLGTAAGWL